MNINAGSNVIEAAQAIAQAEIKKISFDKTIIAQIVKLIDANTGEYKVKHETAVFSAYSSDAYKEGDMVYVKVPNGDMSNKKFIERKYNSSDVDEKDLNKNWDKLMPVGPNIYELYNNYVEDTNEYLLLTGATEHNSPVQYKSRVIYNSQSSGFSDKEFQLYVSQYDKIKLSAEFLTSINTIKEGNYGLKFVFSSKQTEDNPEAIDFFYLLDFDDFYGNPFTYSSYSLQSVTIDISDIKDKIQGLKSIELFESFVDYDSQIQKQYDDAGEISLVEVYNTDEPNIRCRNIDIRFQEFNENYDRNSYIINIATPKGISLEYNRYTILEAGLYFQTQNLLKNNLEDCEISWYYRDEVEPEDEDYDLKVGRNWRKIKYTGNELQYNFTTIDDGITLRIQPLTNAVIFKKDILLCIVYKEETILTKQITLYDLNIDRFYLERDNNKIYLKSTIVNDDIPTDIAWSIIYPSGASEEKGNANPLDILDILEENLDFIVRCQIGDPLNNFYLDLAIGQNTNQLRNINVVFNITPYSNFNYNADGNIASKYTKTECIITPVIQTFSSDINLNTYSYTWVLKNNPSKEDGNPYTILNENAQSPAGTMMKDIWVDADNKVHFKIATRFSYEDFYNTFSLIIEQKLLDERYFFDVSIGFSKDGDLGTNGTNFKCEIVPCSASGEDFADNQLKFFIYYYNSDKSAYTPKQMATGLYFKVKVYKDNNLISNINQYTISWKAENCVITAVANRNDMIQVMPQDDKISTNYLSSYKPDPNYSYTKEFYHRYITVSIQPTDSSYNLFYNYPIDVLLLPELENNPNYNVSINSLPMYILYNSDGKNPVYQMEEEYLSISINNVETKEVIGIYPDNNESIMSYNIAEQKDFEVRQTYNYVDSGNIIVFNQGNIKFIHSVLAYLNKYFNADLNNWDGMKVQIDEKGNYIYAPQIGAGKKDDGNTFTGVLMGSRAGGSSSSSTEKNTGLFGYQKGVNTFGLLSDGTAYFGASNGKIQIDGTNSLIYGGNSKNGANSMTLRLYNSDWNNSTNWGDTRAIDIRDSNNDASFYVTYDGKLHATGATISGNITLSSDSIIAWSNLPTDAVSTTKLNTKLDGYVDKTTFDDTDYIDKSKKNNTKYKYIESTKITSTTIESPTISGGTIIGGQIYGGTIKIGSFNDQDSGDLSTGWIINDNGIWHKNEKVKLNADGSVQFGSTSDDSIGYMKYNPTNGLLQIKGKIEATEGSFTGTITAGSGSKIGGWTIGSSALYNNGGSDTGLISTRYFQVATDGNITATGGKIGGWTIGSNALYKNDGYGQNSGLISTRYFKVDTNGKITASGGTIGGWHISTITLSHGKGDTYSNNTELINADGKFIVDTSGKIIATGVDISGTINATSGTIGGWNINTSSDGKLYYGTGDSALELNPNGDTTTNPVFKATKNFKVYKDGGFIFQRENDYIKTTDEGIEISGKVKLTAGSTITWNQISDHPTMSDYVTTTTFNSTDYIAKSKANNTKYTYIESTQITSATIESPTITGNKGKIGGWNIDGKLYDDDQEIELNPSGTASTNTTKTPAFKAGSKFKVYKDGVLEATGADISGKITANEGNIGGWAINNNEIIAETSNKITYLNSADASITCANIESMSNMKTVTLTDASINFFNMSGTTSAVVLGVIACDPSEGMLITNSSLINVITTNFTWENETLATQKWVTDKNYFNTSNVPKVYVKTDTSNKNLYVSFKSTGPTAADSFIQYSSETGNLIFRNTDGTGFKYIHIGSYTIQ